MNTHVLKLYKLFGISIWKKMNTHDEYEIVSGDCAEPALLWEARDIHDAMLTIQLTDDDSSPEPPLGK